MILLALGLSCLGCSRRDKPPPLGSAEVERLCASACASFTTRECGTDPADADDRSPAPQVDEPTKNHHAACIAACLGANDTATIAGCASEHRAYLACVSALERACPPAGLAPGTALENAAGVSACSREHASYFRCTEPCRDQGAHWTRSASVEHAGRPRNAHAELVSAGCASEAPPKAKKSEAGAPCTHHSVCTPASCDCPRSRVRFVARACVDGRCADAGLACSLAPRVVLHDPCPDP